MKRTQAAIAGAILIVALALTGCAPEPGPGVSDQPDSTSETAAPNEPAAPGEPAAPTKLPATQEESCDWDTPRLGSGSADAPNGMGGDLATVLIGAWQHTHINSGSGYEAMDSKTDIRYVFPSTTRMLFCQDIQGATSQAENAVDITLDGVKLVLPSPNPGYEVMAWTNDIMVLKNNRDGAFYLLKRR